MARRALTLVELLVVDGEFAVVTAFGNRTLNGTMEGRYRVTVIPAFDAKGSPIVAKLLSVYEIKAQGNHLALKLPK